MRSNLILLFFNTRKLRYQNRLVLGVCRTKLLTMHLNPIEGSLMKWYITYLGLHLSSSPASGNIARLYVQIEYYKKEKRFCSALSLYHSTTRRSASATDEYIIATKNDTASLFCNFRLCLSLAAEVPTRSLQRAYALNSFASSSTVCWLLLRGC